MPPASPVTSCHALLTHNLTLCLSPSYIPSTKSLRPPHSRAHTAGSSRHGPSKLAPPFAKAPLHLPTTFITVSPVPTPILSNIYVKLYAQSMTHETMSINLCKEEVRRELVRLASEGTEKARVVEGVKFMFVGIDR